MICEQIIGNIEAGDYRQYQIDYVDIEWYETFKKIHKKLSHQGLEVGIRLGNEILRQGVRQGDILYQDGEKIVAINIPPCECIVVDIDSRHPQMLGKVCYEIGNKHAALFWGKDYSQVVTPYNEPTLRLLAGLHGVAAARAVVRLEMNRGISAAVHNHTH